MEQLSSLHHNMDPRLSKGQSGASSRILYDIPCKVCQDHSSGKHYGIFACDGCAGFFKRSIRRARQYVCKAKAEGGCTVDKTHRNQCRACRLTKCVQAGMNKEAVQHERGPRNSTLRRQMALYFKEPTSPTSSGDAMSPPRPRVHHHRTPPPSQPPPHHVLDLALPKPTHRPTPAPHPMLHPAAYMCARPAALQFPVPAQLSAETVCESAARLLFMNVQWAKSVPAFTALHYRDQLLLLEESWRELFVLGAAQFRLPLEANARVLAHKDGLHQELRIFQDTLNKFEALSVDPHEYACLRAIVLFKTAFENTSSVSSSSGSPSGSEAKGLRDASSVAALQDHTQLTLSKYISTAHPAQPFRFGKLLLLLPALKAVAANTIEEMFFRRTIGLIPIERIICDMYKASDL